MANPSFLDWKALSADYGTYHTHPMNRRTHIIGIPSIMFCIIDWTQFGGGIIPVCSVVLPLYFFWDKTLAVAMTVLMALMASLTPQVGPRAIWAIFIVGWIFQLLGHYVWEKKSPAFTKNLLQLLVGPMWIMDEVLGISERRRTKLDV